MGRQLKFFDARIETEHGGEINLGKRKTVRPFVPNRPLHYVMRSERAIGKLSLHHKRNEISKLLKNHSIRFGVKLYDFSVNRTHVHLVLVAHQKKDIQNFTRTVTGLIARLVTGACSGKKLSGPFWSRLIYSRLASWGKELKRLLAYIQKNRLETLGRIAYTPRPVRMSFVPRRV